MSDVERGQDATDTTTRGGVLVAVDGSETSERSLLWAAREAARRGAPLTVVHCYYWPSSGLGAMDAGQDSVRANTLRADGAGDGARRRPEIRPQEIQSGLFRPHAGARH